MHGNIRTQLLDDPCGHFIDLVPDIPGARDGVGVGVGPVGVTVTVGVGPVGVTVRVGVTVGVMVTV